MITLKYVLSELQGRRDFHGVGIKGGYLEAVLFETAWKDSSTQKWEERNFKQREDAEKCNSSADLKHVYQERFSCICQEPAGSNSLQMVFFEDTGLQGPHRETGQSYRSRQGILRPPDTSNVREPLSPEEVSSIKDPAESWSPGRGLSHGSWGWEACDHCQRRGSKAERDGEKHPDFFSFCSAYANASVAKLNKTSTSKGPWMTGHRHRPPGRWDTNRAEKNQEWKLGE